MTTARGGRGRDRVVGCAAAAGVLGALLGLQALPGAGADEGGGSAPVAEILLPPADGVALPSLPGYRYIGRVALTGTVRRQLPVQPGAEVAVRLACGPVTATPPAGSGPAWGEDGDARLDGSGDRALPCTDGPLVPLGSAPGGRSAADGRLPAGAPIASTPAVVTLSAPEGRSATADLYQRLDSPWGQVPRRLGVQAPAAASVGFGSGDQAIVPGRADMNGVHRLTVPDDARVCYAFSTPGTLTVLVDGRAADVGEEASGWSSSDGVDGVLSPQVEAPMAACRDLKEMHVSTALPDGHGTRELTVVTEHFADPGWRLEVSRAR